MAMTLPLSPASGNSPSSDIEAPCTPASPVSQQDSPSLQQNNQQAIPSSPTNATPTQAKRKPSRRANTAERRATHNAVERQRRETLNGRFLDLAALLPNLSQIRRPSKSSIVNSSIAHIHASRRHRMLAARELRMLKHEADALRRELNEWRDRAGIPRMEEPVRGDAFSMILSGELEVIAAVPGEEDPDDEDGYPGYPDEDYPGVIPGPPIPHPHGHHPSAHPHLEEMEDPRIASMMKSGHPFPHNIPSGSASNGLHLAHILPRPSTGGAPMLTSSTSFEAAGMYDSHHGFGGSGAAGSAAFMQQQQQQSMDAEKVASWYGAQSQQQMMQRSLFTPPATSHGLPGSSNNNNGNGNNSNNGSASPVNPNPASNGGNISNSPSPASTNPFTDPSSQAFFTANISRPQQGYISDDGSAGNSGSNGKRISVPVPVPVNVAGRGRALSTASHGAHSVNMNGSPGGASPASTGVGSPTYEVDNATFGRRPGPPNGWRDEVPVSQHHGHGLMGMGMGMSSSMMIGGMGMGMNNGMVANSMGAMVSVGGPGGGSGGGFAMMM